MTKERYFAVRIGNPKKHRCYFLCRYAVPQLFNSKEDAQAQADLDKDRAVVGVEIREICKAKV